jgi:NitT/TauT family transport system ATP-binding protein
MTDGAAAGRPPDGATAAVDVRGLSKRFGPGPSAVVALQDIELSVPEGEFVSLVGPSGCGKSTLLNIVGGLLRQTFGEVLVHGAPVAGETPREVGMMFQSPVLLPWRTARANVVLPLEVEGGRAAVRAAAPRVDELLRLVGLAGFEDSYPSQLSGGMQQRVAICRMLIADPQVLLLDEPFGALDELTREHMNVELDRIVAGSGRTTLFVTHNIAEAVFLSDRVVVMTRRPGRIAGIVDVALARPRELESITDPAFQALVRRVRDLLEEGATGDELLDRRGAA